MQPCLHGVRLPSKMCVFPLRCASPSRRGARISLRPPQVDLLHHAARPKNAPCTYPDPRPTLTPHPPLRPLQGILLPPSILRLSVPPPRAIARFRRTSSRCTRTDPYPYFPIAADTPRYSAIARSFTAARYKIVIDSRRLLTLSLTTTMTRAIAFPNIRRPALFHALFRPSSCRRSFVFAS